MDDQKRFEKKQLNKEDHKIMPNIVSAGKKVLGVVGTVGALTVAVLVKTDNNPFKKN